MTATADTAPGRAAPRRPLSHLARWAACGLLCAVFAWAAVGKLQAPAVFATDISHYQVLTDPLVGIAAVGLPVFELVLAVGLLIPALHRGSALLSGALLLVFAGAMAQAKLRGIDLACGCFGADTDVAVDLTTILRNLALAALALWVAFRRERIAKEPTG